MLALVWRPGDTALLRHVDEGRVSRVVPALVVEDSRPVTALYTPAGARIKIRYGGDGRPIERSLPYAERWSQPWTLGDGEWSVETLVLGPARAPYAYLAYWDAAWRFQGWYVNLQAPLRRTPLGWDTTDHVLDVLVAPDLSRWEWKDEDELEDAVRVGRFTQAEAAAVRADGEQALAALAERRWPFDRDRSSWRPDPTWSLRPHLPETWDEPPRPVL
jgi:uncharacterized protein